MHRLKKGRGNAFVIALSLITTLIVSALFVLPAHAVTIGTPEVPFIIDENTGGDWLEVYGDCFYLIPTPQGPGVELPTGPDWFSDNAFDPDFDQYPLPPNVVPWPFDPPFPALYGDIYGNQCYGGVIVPISEIDWRIFRNDDPPYDHAFTYMAPISITEAAQWNPCLPVPDGDPNTGEFLHGTWDSHFTSRNPLVVELELKVGGDLTIAYYFTNAEGVCREQSIRLEVDQDGDGGVDATMNGTIGDFEQGKYVVFSITDLPLPADSHIITFSAWNDDTGDCGPSGPTGQNAHISGVFISGSTACNIGVCGDEIVEPPETCDPPGEAPDPAYPLNTCREVTCTYCGDGIVNNGEQCDFNNTDPAAPECNTDCTLVPVCGDGNVDTDLGETCDPPGSTPDPAYPLNTCSDNCNYCGDGEVNDGEVCDFNDTDPAAPECNTDCTLVPVCGDGNVDTDLGETCDPPGSTPDPAYPLNTCREVTCTYCGDGIVNNGEVCDFNNTDPAAPECNTDCTLVPVCGDGNVDTDLGETCDPPGSTPDPAYPLNTCSDNCNYCGDGEVNDGEVCDFNDTDPAAPECNTDCTLVPVCGDGNVDTDLGETCDPPGSTPDPAYPLNTCSDNCTYCGDGIVNNGEVCDFNDPTTPECRTNCTLPECGDEILDDGEFCDPPGSIPDDNYPNNVCRDTCTYCGDGEVNNGEECDFNDPTTPECRTDCTLPEYDEGTGTPGFWKNKGWKDGWPLSSIIMAPCNDTYPAATAREWLKTSVSNDKTISMFFQLTAAKLNVANGTNPTCIAGTIAAAEAWMCAHPVGSGVPAESDAWQMGAPSASTMHTMLDNYNNGYMCAPHRDD